MTCQLNCISLIDLLTQEQSNKGMLLMQHFRGFTEPI